MKMPGKKKLGKFWNEKARAQLLSGVVVALMVLATFTGLFLLSGNVSASSTYTYTEDFSDDSGSFSAGSVPDATWYNSTATLLTYTLSTDTVDISTSHAVQGTHTLHIAPNGTVDAREGCAFNLSGGSHAIDYFNISLYIDQGPSTHNYSHVLLTYDTNKVCHISFTNTGDIKVYSDGSWVDTGFDWGKGWYNISIELNWTDHTQQFTINSTDVVPWCAMATVQSGVTGFGVFGSINSGDVFDAYIDYIEIGSPTQIGGSGTSYPSAPTGASATAYTTFDISLSGLDANSRITFPTAHTSDTSGDIVWANETSYGVLTVSNDGVQLQ